jgi:dTDP-glucose 4,6-dehydratase
LRVIVTGGAGFVGSHLCDRFLSLGHHVIAVDNLITGSQANIEHLATNPDFEFRNIDISESFQIEGEVDAIMQFASPASPPHYLKLPLETLKVGAFGNYNALELAREKGAKLLFASTSEIYGDPLEHPQHEGYLGNVSTIGPRSVYDEAKRFAESMTIAYHRTHSVQTRIVRIFNTYGPRMNLADGRVVPNFIVQSLRGEPLTIYGDGQQTRSFQYVSDLIDGLLALLDSDYVEPVNIGNPHEMTIKEFAETVNMVTGNTAGITFQPDERVSGDPQRRQPDISLAKRVLNWEPKVGLREGLEQTIAYFQQQVP